MASSRRTASRPTPSSHAKTNGPTAKSSTSTSRHCMPGWARRASRPSNLWCGDEASREVARAAQSRCRLRPGLHGADRERRRSGSTPRRDLRDQQIDGSVRVPVCATRALVNRAEMKLDGARRAWRARPGQVAGRCASRSSPSRSRAPSRSPRRAIAPIDRVPLPDRVIGDSSWARTTCRPTLHG